MPLSSSGIEYIQLIAYWALFLRDLEVWDQQLMGNDLISLTMAPNEVDYVLVMFFTYQGSPWVVLNMI